MELSDGEGSVLCVTGVARIRVRGRILDADTGAHVGGATLWIHSCRKDALEETDRRSDIEPDAISAADGTFDLRVSRYWHTSGEPFRLTPFCCARALAIETAGYPRQVVDCTGGAWTEHEVRDSGDLAGTADLGDVRISR